MWNGAKTPDDRSLRRLNFVRWRQIFVEFDVRRTVKANEMHYFSTLF